MNGLAERFIHREQRGSPSRMTLQLPIARKDQLDSYARFIVATIDPLCPRPTIFANGRDTLYVEYK